MDEVRSVKPAVKFDDFARLDLRVARVLDCREHTNADKLLVLKVDLGTERRQICAALKAHYRPDELVGKLVVVLANLETRNMRGEASQGMILMAKEAAKDGHERVVVLSPTGNLAPGTPAG